MASRNGGRKIVSIPVLFPQTEQERTASAVKIQKAVRGFLVMKSVKQIMAIMRELEEVERWTDSEKVKESGIDDKERLRAKEKLMSLLLKLDSVRGISCAVRDCRRRVIKIAIALQEKVDSIPTPADFNSNPNSADAATKVLPPEEEMEEEPKTIHCMTDDVVVMPSSSPDDDLRKEVENKGDEIEREKKRTRELLERMVEDNEKLVGMVTELSQKNEMQTRLLSSLTQRVELLEKALVSEKLARMKKKKRQQPPNPN